MDANKFWRTLLDSSKVTFPGDKDFQTALISNNLYETIASDGCKYLLYSLERAIHSKELPVYPTATVEHILPQKLSSEWKEYLKERNDSQTYELWLHTLGNLTLTAYNAELGNADFDGKKKIYAQSSFYYTRALKDYPEWTSKQIQKRAQKLATEAIKIWALPEKFNSRFANLGETFTLDSDFGKLIGTKPASVSISETEIKISNWSGLLREIVKQLYALDNNIFHQATQMENVPRRDNLFSTSEKSFRYEFKVDENYYMALGQGTDVCLRIVKALVENFDSIGGTNFKEDIYITLRR